MQDFPQLKLMPKNTSVPGSREFLSQYAMPYLNAKPETTLNMLFDRFTVPAEDVYGPILRGNNVFPLREWLIMEEKFLSHRPLIILCERSVEKIMETFDEREQLFGVRENIDKLIKRYHYVLARTGVQWFFLYNFDYTDYETVKDFVGDYLDMEEKRWREESSSFNK